MREDIPTGAKRENFSEVELPGAPGMSVSFNEVPGYALIHFAPVERLAQENLRQAITRKEAVWNNGLVTLAQMLLTRSDIIYVGVRRWEGSCAVCRACLQKYAMY